MLINKIFNNFEEILSAYNFEFSDNYKNKFSEIGNYLCTFELNPRLSYLDEYIAKFVHNVIILQCKDLIKSYYNLNQIWYNVW